MIYSLDRERGGTCSKGSQVGFQTGPERVVACGPTELNWHRYILHNF